MDALDTFIASVTAAAKKVGDTAANFGECVGLVEVWFDTELSPHVWGNAKDLYANAASGYLKGTSWPAPRGAAGIMDGSWGAGAGHTWLSLGNGKVFEQNNPKGSLPKLSNYGTVAPKGYIGWILPNNFKGGSEMATPHQIDLAFQIGFNRPANKQELDNPDYLRDTTLLLQTIFNNNLDFRTKAANFDNFAKALEDASAQLKDTQKQLKAAQDQLASIQAGNGDATKWQTLKALLKSLIS